jgi:hypothetical protein
MRNRCPRVPIAAVIFVSALTVVLSCAPPGNEGPSSGPAGEGGSAQTCSSPPPMTGVFPMETDCAAGQCAQSCDASFAWWDATYAGGHCQQQCGKDLLECDLSCDGGDCDQDCEAASCVVSCSGGGCTCHGNGCLACPNGVLFAISTPTACCLAGDNACSARGLSCIQHWDAGACCFADSDCASVGGSCWLFPGATAGHCGVAETGRCCVGGSAYTCSTGTAYAACAGFDWRTCQAACASTDAACLSACQSNASSSPGGDPSGCTRDSSDDTMCVPSPYCAGSPDGSPCTTDSDCPAGNCQNDGCYPNADGNPCTVDAQCDSNNCFNYCCTPNTYGSPCGADASCASYNCQGGPARGDGSGNGACVTNTPRAGAWTTGPVLRAELASVYEASGMSPSRRLRLQDVQSISPVPSGCRRLDLHLRLSLCGHIVSFEVAGAVSRD